MTLDEYKTKILASAENDWTRIGCWGAGTGPSYRDALSVWKKGSGEFLNLDIDSHSEILSLKSDLLISVAFGITHNNDFVEDWANSFADPHASSEFVDFFYGTQLVFRDVYVSVDGGRCCLPLPEIKLDESNNEVNSLTVPEDKYRFFRLLNRSADDYDSYLSRAGITVINGDWMS